MFTVSKARQMLVQHKQWCGLEPRASNRAVVLLLLREAALSYPCLACFLCVSTQIGTEKEDALLEAIKTRMEENKVARDAAAAAAAGRKPSPPSAPTTTGNK